VNGRWSSRNEYVRYCCCCCQKSGTVAKNTSQTTTRAVHSYTVHATFLVWFGFVPQFVHIVVTLATQFLHCPWSTNWFLNALFPRYNVTKLIQWHLQRSCRRSDPTCCTGGYYQPRLRYNTSHSCQ
jgi:hypothetical protein